MKGTGHGHRYIPVCIILLILSVTVFATGALADDEALQTLLPGRWTLTGEIQDLEGTGIRTLDLAYLTLEEDGSMVLTFEETDGFPASTLQGTWSFEPVEGGMDRLRLSYSLSGDAPLTESVYSVYAESWVEQDTFHVYMILEEGIHTASALFETLTGYDSAAFHREQGPNMQVVRCKNYVSLREKRSKTSARVARVPLGACVLAFPEYGTENGFLFCSYHGREGYILTDYLAPIEASPDP